MRVRIKKFCYIETRFYYEGYVGSFATHPDHDAIDRIDFVYDMSLGQLLRKRVFTGYRDYEWAVLGNWDFYK